MFAQWSKSKANTNVSHFKQFYQQITDSNTKLLSLCWEVNWGQSLCLSTRARLEGLCPARESAQWHEAGQWQNLRLPVAASSLPWGSEACCPAVRYREREEDLLLVTSSATSQLPLGGGGGKTNIGCPFLLVTSSSVVSRRLQKEMLLSLAFFWQVLTLLLRCVAPHPITNPIDNSGTELHAVMHSVGLVLHLVLNSRRSGTTPCPQSHVAQIGSCKQCLWLVFLTAHQLHPLFCASWPLVFSGLRQSPYGLSTQLSSSASWFRLFSFSIQIVWIRIQLFRSSVEWCLYCTGMWRCREVFECVKSHGIMLGDCVAWRKFILAWSCL